MINPNALGVYAPKTGEKARLSYEAQKTISETIYLYKQLFYGLRQLAWKTRDKKAIFYEALSNGELDRFKVAPGRRLSDGSYSPDEWDYDGLNLYLWQRFAERFNEAFDIETVQDLKTMKDLKECVSILLSFALDNWGEMLLKDRLLDEEEEPKNRNVNLDLMKEKLLEINRDNYQERRANMREQQPVTRRFNDEIDGTVQKPKVSRKQQKELEAAQWLAAHPEFSNDEPF
ncbi:MAG: hypothetical protein N5P05_004120 (plasmid) [Chroococcopsis gigantea SAG 12.99]|jgi:hypothetical protein|nr:hypothetical protein [Chroococcopsis gigantea SAG 12.99]